MKKLLAIVLLTISAAAARADMTAYFMLSVFSPGQLPSPACDVYGIRFSFLYGESTLALFGLKRIPPESVVQSPILLKRVADLKKNL